MSPRIILGFLAVLPLLFCAVTAGAQQMSSPYGPSISLENAKKAAAAAIAESRKNNWTMAVAVVDPSGTLVYYEKTDNTQTASAEVAIEKARASAMYKRPTKSFEEAVAKGGEGLRVLTLKGVVAADGAVPIVVDGKIIGAIGLSGGTSAQDGQCAQVGADALK